MFHSIASLIQNVRQPIYQNVHQPIYIFYLIISYYRNIIQKPISNSLNLIIRLANCTSGYQCYRNV